MPYECTLGCDGHGFHKRMFIANSTYELRQPLCSFVRAHTVFAGGDVVDEVGHGANRLFDCRNGVYTIMCTRHCLYTH